jgi:hypothetical protein
MQLFGGLGAVLQRHAAERGEAVGVLADILRDAVVQNARRRRREFDRHRVVELRRTGADELHVDAHIVHRLEAHVRRADGGSDVGGLLGHQVLGRLRREMVERHARRIELALHQLRRLRNGDLCVHIDGEALGPRLAAGPAALAGHGRFILVPHRQIPR